MSASLREWQAALARMLWEGDRTQFVSLIAANEMPREIQLEIGRLLTAPKGRIHNLKVEVSEREARRFHTLIEGVINGVEVDRASGGAKRGAGVHAIHTTGKRRSKLFADRALLGHAASALRDARAAWTPDERQAFDEAWTAGDPACLTVLEEIWRPLSGRSPATQSTKPRRIRGPDLRDRGQQV
jgi:hypothetical protein